MAVPRSTSREERMLLLTITLATLPLFLTLLWFNYASVLLADQKNRLLSRRRIPKTHKTVLITGAASPYGLDLARAFTACGWRVVGADLNPQGLWNVAKRSSAISKHYDLPQLSAVRGVDHLARCLLILAKNELVELWIDCSHDIPAATISAARKAINDRQICGTIAIDQESSHFLNESTAFQDFLRNRGLPTTQMHHVESRSQVHKILNATVTSKKQYILRSSDGRNASQRPRTLLPRRTLSQTYHEVSLMRVTPESHMVLEETLDAKSSYTCFAIVINGALRYFFAQQTTGNNPLTNTSALWQALKTCTEAVARELGHDFSSHLTLTYGLQEEIAQHRVVQQIVVSRGTFRPDETFVHARGHTEAQALVLAYASKSANDINGDIAVFQGSVDNQMRSQNVKRYFLPELIITSTLRPCLGFIWQRASFHDVVSGFVHLINTLTSCHEAFYSFRDPVPAFWHNTIGLMRSTIMLQPNEHEVLSG